MRYLLIDTRFKKFCKAISKKYALWLITEGNLARLYPEWKEVLGKLTEIGVEWNLECDCVKASRDTNREFPYAVKWYVTLDEEGEFYFRMLGIPSPIA